MYQKQALVNKQYLMIGLVAGVVLIFLALISGNLLLQATLTQLAANNASQTSVDTIRVAASISPHEVDPVPLIAPIPYVDPVPLIAPIPLP